MSLHFLGFDVLDGIPIAHYLSDEDEVSHDERSREHSSHSNSVISLGGSFASNSSTTPPVWIQVAPNSVQEEDDSEEEEGSRGGVTILSSVPSSQVSLVCRGRPAAEISVISTSPRLLGNATTAEHLHALSISTTESLYDDQHSLSSQVLSLGPSSLASSLVDVSLRDISFSPGSSSGQRHYHEPIVLRRVADHLSTDPTASDEEITQNQQNPKIWYADFKTEQDWERFTEQTLQVLAALGEDQQLEREKDPEKRLALLIQQEENLFWQDPSDRRRRHCHYAWIFLGEMAIALATATVASFSAASLARR